MIKTLKKIHLWLGIITGPFVFIIALTGSIYAFQEEIQNLTQEFRFYEKKGAPQLRPSELKKCAEKANPGRLVHAVMNYSDNRASQVIFYQYENYYDIVYINPETGAVLKVQDAESGFFPFILKGHFYLWLPSDIGQPIVATTTLIFLFVVLIGLIIWWPRKGKKIDRFKFKRNVSWKRRNFDLHSVLGFYVLIFSIIFSITGLVWGFEWFRNSYYSVSSLGEKYVQYYEPQSNEIADSISVQLDKVYYRLSVQNPSFYSIEVHPPETVKGSIAANVNYSKGTYWKTDYYYFDQVSLKDLPVNHYWSKLKKASTADLLMRVNYDVHTGSILGFPGKILAFLLGLVIASLPVTGFLFYLGRKKKER